MKDPGGVEKPSEIPPSGPEGGMVPEAREGIEQDITGLADRRVAELESSQARDLQRTESEAAQNLETSEIQQIAQETGVRGSLARIAGRAHEMRNSLERKWLNYQMRKGLKEASGKWGINTSYYKLREAIAKLTPEEARAYPEVIAAAQARAIQSIKSYGLYFPENEGLAPAIQEIHDLFKGQPEIAAEVLKSPEVKQVVEDAFKNCLLTSYTQHRARRMMDSVQMDLGRAQEIVLEAIRNRIHKKEGFYETNRGAIYDAAMAIKDFEIPENVSEELAKEFVLVKLKEGDWLRLGDLNPYIPSPDKGPALLASNRDAVSSAAYDGALNLLQGPGAKPSVVENFLAHLRKECSLETDVAGFKEALGGEPMRKAILGFAESGEIVMPGNLQELAKLSSGPIQEILDSAEGQEALRRGAQKLLRKGDLDTLKTFMSQFGPDIEKMKRDPETLQSVRALIEYDLKDKVFAFRKEAIDMFDIPEEDVHDIRIRVVSNMTRNGNYDGAFALLDSTPVTAADEVALSQDIFGVPDKFEYLQRIKNLAHKRVPYAAFDILIKEHAKFSDRSPEQLGMYISISEKIASSPSQEMVRLKDQLVEQILLTEDPERAYEMVADIFIQNNLPLIGKIQRVFDVLYPDKILSRELQNYEGSSPVLRHATARRRRHAIYNDLLRIHIESNNPSLRKFLLVLKDSQALIGKLDSGAGLSPEEKKKLAYAFRKMKTLADVSSRGRRLDLGPVDTSSLESTYAELRKQLGAAPGQPVSERIVAMFAKPLGFGTLEEVLSAMERSRGSAEQRAREEAGQGEFKLAVGDLAKGFSSEHIESILQSGAVAGEYLGALANSDKTPFDTDVERVAVAGADFEESFRSLRYVYGYGDVVCVIKNRGQFQESARDAVPNYDPSKYELFQTAVVGKDHYGIRTGIASSEISMLVAQNPSDYRTLERLRFGIAQNDRYIPVLSPKGELLFTPEMFEDYRKVFAGIKEFNGPPMEFRSSKGSPHYSELVSIMEAKRQDAERLAALKLEIRSKLSDILQEFNIKLKADYDDSIVGAELMDTGSTGRGTNMPGDGDFDFALRLDNADFENAPKIIEMLQQKLSLNTTEATLSNAERDSYQLRIFGTEVFSGKLDIDIGLVRKSQVQVYASHDAVADKLASIKENFGAEAYDETVANILLAKKWLKAAEVYKKGAGFGQGGLGGIGVENLVLAHGGNVERAFRAFYEGARKPDGSFMSFGEFKENFRILDAGLNLRFNNHDNFVYNMTEQGYQKMLDAIKARFYSGAR